MQEAAGHKAVAEGAAKADASGRGFPADQHSGRHRTTTDPEARADTAADSQTSGEADYAGISSDKHSKRRE